MGAKAKTKDVKVGRGTLRSALVSQLKTSTGRKDIKFDAAPELAAKSQMSISIKQRAGYPLKFPKGAVDPKDWKTAKGDKIEVDFSRCAWLPDDWGQGIKATSPISRNMGGGGILTTFVGPDMKAYFHRHKVEEYVGRKLTDKDGWNGQVRRARLQAQQAIELSRQSSKENSEGLIAATSDATFFKVLSSQERKNLPSKDEFHFAVVSARRATSISGVQDIFMVQCQLEDAGVTPTWYVDEGSVKDYQLLGLKAVVGGKLTPSRNKALQDARSKGKVCVQLSDDICSWEYRDGKNATVRTDDALNAAHANATRHIVSPVAAARFILAKMRSCENPKPKLGGVYMLGSCARTFYGDAFSRQHFILGDFFVVDIGSKVNFDEEMRLKEDYDVSCAHINAHGSVMRCNRMTLSVKHYDNGGGACTMRDKKGLEEQRNVKILNTKWPGCFRANPKRKNEVIMKWKDPKKRGITTEDAAEDDDDEEEILKPKSKSKSSSGKKPAATKAKKNGVKKVAMKVKRG